LLFLVDINDPRLANAAPLSAEGNVVISRDLGSGNQ
jgi:hypothetical protein